MTNDQFASLDEAVAPAVETVLQSTWAIPAWCWILCSVLGISFVIWIYWSERGSAGTLMRSLLALLRFLLLLAVLWMLSGWNWLRFKSDRPELAMLVDHSASMATRDVALDSRSTDAAISRAQAITDLFDNLSPSVRRSMQENYDIKWYAVAETLEPMSSLLESEATGSLLPRGTQSKLGEGLSQLISRQSGHGAAAVVFLSDGINTAGPGLEQSEQLARSAAIPVYTAVFGRDFTLPDLHLANLLMERQVFFGDRVTAEVSLVASDVQQARTRITLVDQDTNRVLDEQVVALDTGANQTTALLSFIPDRPGKITLTIHADVVEGETDLSNNSLTHVVNVQDKTLRVMLVQDQPSYEFRFLKHLLERSRQVGESRSASFALSSILQESDPEYVRQDQSALRLVPSDEKQLSDIDVFVFGPFQPELISRRSQEIILQAVTEHGAGCMFIDGSGSLANKLQGWPLGTLLPVTSGDESTRVVFNGPSRWEPSPIGLSAMPLQLATTPAESLSIWQRLPGMQLVSNLGELKTGAQVLAFAVDTATQHPLLIAQYAGAGRVVLQATEETFRWTSFAGSDLYHQRYWEQMLRWLSRGRLKLSTRESTLLVEPRQAKIGQAVRFEAQIGVEVAADSLPETARVSLISDQQYRSSLELIKTEQSNRVFRATATHLPPGRYQALLLQPATEDPPSQEFTIVAPPGEQSNLRADSGAMQSLAAVSRGRFYTVDNASRLFRELPEGKSTRIAPLPPLPLWNNWWVIFAFTLLITTEWIIRRRVRMI